MDSDTRDFVTASTVCAQSKASHLPPTGLLCPFPVPHCPWSHIAVDFVTGLPPSRGNSVILTVIERFSKAVHFIVLPKLPTACETADPQVNHVFYLYGIPLDIVSDRGPQFTSQVRMAFCKVLGAIVSLSSGFHPQTHRETERAKQELKAVLWCVVEASPLSWSSHLARVEYAHDSQTSAATGMSSLKPPLVLNHLVPLSGEQDCCSIGSRPPPRLPQSL